MEPEEWDKVMKTNLGGVFNFCHELAFPMMQKRAGRIINISSVAATHVNPGQTNYAASKGAINSFTRALAVELAGRGVTVNAIAPGFIETDMSAAVRNKAGDLIKKFIPMKRIGTPEDIARVAVFLASAGQRLHHRTGADRGRRPESWGRGGLVIPARVRPTWRTPRPNRVRIPLILL